jgi:hypothetical protein
MQLAAQHAGECPECMEKLAAWNEISDVAKGMHAGWKNEMLWPRIERSVRDERRREHARIWQIAAAVVLLTGLAFVTWTINQRNRASDFDESIIRASAVDEAEKAEKAHIGAINRLEKHVGPKLENASTPLMVSYREKLMLLDDAIAECQTNIDRNRQNAHLRRQLLAIYSEKQRTLQDVLREERHGSNQ